MLALKVCLGLFGLTEEWKLESLVPQEVVGDGVKGLIHLPLLRPGTVQLGNGRLGVAQHGRHCQGAKRIGRGPQWRETVVDGRDSLTTPCEVGFDHGLFGVLPSQHAPPPFFVCLLHDLPVRNLLAHVQCCAGDIEQSICSISLLRHSLVFVSLVVIILSFQRGVGSIHVPHRLPHDVGEVHSVTIRHQPLQEDKSSLLGQWEILVACDAWLSTLRQGELPHVVGA